MTPKPEPRLTLQSLRILRALDERPAQRLAGADIRRLTGLSSGTLYPTLIRLEQAGWLESEWEEVDPREVGRPRKRLYRLTATGTKKAAEARRQVGYPVDKMAWA